MRRVHYASYLTFLRAGMLAAVLLSVSTAKDQSLSGDLLPPVPVPSDNPQTEAKVKLGAQLFFDKRLSADNTLSCASCHTPKTGWANHNRTDTGIRHQVGNRNSGTILFSGYMRFQFWDGRAASLEQQSIGPMENPIEMGETLENVVAKLNAIPGYKAQFRKVFKTDVTSVGIAKAIAAFERTVNAGPSPYDRFLQGDTTALSASAKRGLIVFNGNGRCVTCHSGPTFSDQGFHNLGVGFRKGKFSDIGRQKVTHLPEDLGAFKTPGLRNVADTFPYMHDGSESTLEAVVELYARGGVQNPNLDPLMAPVALTRLEKSDLVAFLKALSGPLPAIQEPELPK